MSPDLTLAATFWHDTLDSTNLEARRRIADGQASPVWLATAEQTAGKGRAGRNWVSKRGNLFATLLFPLDGDLKDAARLPFAMGVAAAEALSGLGLSPHVQLKWPNDLRAGRRKLGGILVETVEQSGVNWAICGIGINVVSAPGGLDQETTSLAALGAPPGLDAQMMLERLKPATARAISMASENFDALLARWRTHAEGIGERVRTQPGGQVVEGVFEGLEPTGALRLRLANGAVTVIHAGDVNLVE
jgi:BirA family transcriptional regulator, biotin operon repressor / biotin---[acetyl-CoA-carboxylase] ligase